MRKRQRKKNSARPAAKPAPASPPPAEPGPVDPPPSNVVWLGPGLLMTRRQLAAFLGVHPMTVTKWQDQGLPIAQHGGRGVESKYKLSEVVQWRIDNEVQRLGANIGKPLDPVLEAARLNRAKAEKTEMEVAVRRGELLEVAAVEHEWGKLVAATRAKILLLPGLLVQRGLVDARGEDEARALVEDVLRELAVTELEVEPETAAG